ncbi:MAG: SpoIVB peptidase [Clostridia bacterium]|nr:SpoIVB peptidase [Clostridia bacterium]
MKRFFRSLSVVLSVLGILIFSFIAYADSTVSDSFESVNGETEIGCTFLSLEGNSAVKALGFTNSDGEYIARLMAFDLFPIKEVSVNSVKRRYVGVGGDVFGIKLYTKGVMAVKIDSLDVTTGEQSPAQLAGIKCGDCITHVDGSVIINADDFVSFIRNSGGKELSLTVERDGDTLNLKLTPNPSESGSYRAGLWVRDSSAGIGTVTFYDTENKIFAGLGHGVCDVDTGKIMPLSGGEAVRATVNGFYKSTPGDPGELCGIFSESVLGSLRVNSVTGIFGELKEKISAKQMPVALETEVHEGEAQIVVTIDGNDAQYYDAQITKIYPASGNEERNLIVKITDKELLAKTGGILQGMSGSPIIQNSMLVGAVTHVFVNDPTQGYGIFAQRMLETADEIIGATNKEAA